MAGLQHAISNQVQNMKIEMDKEHRAAEEQRHRKAFSCVFFILMVLGDNRQKLFSWLPMLGEERKERASRLAVRGTGDWVVRTQEFTQWKEDQVQILCIDGIGKQNPWFLVHQRSNIFSRLW